MGKNKTLEDVAEEYGFENDLEDKPDTYVKNLDDIIIEEDEFGDISNRIERRLSGMVSNISENNEGCNGVKGFLESPEFLEDYDLEKTNNPQIRNVIREIEKKGETINDEIANLFLNNELNTIKNKNQIKTIDITQTFIDELKKTDIPCQFEGNQDYKDYIIDVEPEENKILFDQKRKDNLYEKINTDELGYQLRRNIESVRYDLGFNAISDKIDKKCGKNLNIDKIKSQSKLIGLIIEKEYHRNQKIDEIKTIIKQKGLDKCKLEQIDIDDYPNVTPKNPDLSFASNPFVEDNFTEQLKERIKQANQKISVVNIGDKALISQYMTEKKKNPIKSHGYYPKYTKEFEKWKEKQQKKK